MTEFLILLLIACMWCFGIFTPFQEGYILESVGDRIRKVIGKQFSKPIFGCPPCMSSLHGAAIGLFWWGIDIRVIPFIVCLCGLNFIIKNIIFPEYEPMSEPLDKETEDEIKEVLEFEENSIELAHRQRLINVLYDKYLGK